MDYSKGYFQATYLVNRIREAAASGSKPTMKSGLAARLSDSEKRNSGYNLSEVTANYINEMQNLFEPVREKAKAAPVSDTVVESSLRPERSPQSWASAPFYQAVSAEVDDPTVRDILETIKSNESNGNYAAKNKKGSASGGYQFINDTWNSLTSKYGVGTEYKSAKSAPPEVQDAVAAAYVKDILANNNGDVTKVPLVWYTGNAAGKMSAEALAVNNGYTPQQYQDRWMKTYYSITE